MLWAYYHSQGVWVLSVSSVPRSWPSRRDRSLKLFNVIISPFPLEKNRFISFNLKMLVSILSHRIYKAGNGAHLLNDWRLHGFWQKMSWASAKRPNLDLGLRWEHFWNAVVVGGTSQMPGEQHDHHSVFMWRVHFSLDHESVRSASSRRMQMEKNLFHLSFYLAVPRIEPEA